MTHLADETSSHRVSNQRTQIGGYNIHLLAQIGGKILAKFRQFHHALSEINNIDHVHYIQGKRKEGGNG
jgi:hypothetical protein